MPATKGKKGCLHIVTHKNIPAYLKGVLLTNPQEQTQKVKKNGETKECAPKKGPEKKRNPQEKRKWNRNKQYANKEVKVMIIKMLERRAEELSDTSNKEKL